MQLVANQLAVDAELNAAKKTILERIAHHAAKLTKIEPPHPELQQSYEQTLKAFGKLRGQNLFYPLLGSGMGNGALVELADGSVKYDFVTGIGVHFGHLHPRLVEACLDSATQNLVLQGNLMQNTDSYELAELLVKSSGIEHCVFTTSGAMANENALKLFFHHKPHATRVLAFENCFMGRTLTLSQVTDKPAYRQGLPLNTLVDYVPFFDWKEPEKSTEQAKETLLKLLRRYPNQYACMCFELIQGEGGCYPGQQAFFKELMQILKEHEVAIFADEVQSFGRTDHLFAFQHYGLEEYVDIVTAGKLLHVCATLYRPKWCPRPGLVSQTFTSATSVIRSGHAILSSLLEDGYLGENGKNMKLSRYFVSKLEALCQRHPDKASGPFGNGMMIAFTPFGGDHAKVVAYLHALFQAGVITFLSGKDPARVRFLVPAGSVTTDDIDQVVGIVEEELLKV